MNTLPVSTVIEAIITLFTEAYAGPPDPSETWFIDNAANSGILGVLDGISAEEAATSVDGSGQNGSTIASNVEHLRWSLANANNTFRGQPWNPNWGQSWEPIQVDAGKWDSLRRDLRAEFESLRELLQAQTELEGVHLLGVLAMIPHAAFHLGLMRQQLERVRAAAGK